MNNNNNNNNNNIKERVIKSVNLTHNLFGSKYNKIYNKYHLDQSESVLIKSKIISEYEAVKHMAPPVALKKHKNKKKDKINKISKDVTIETINDNNSDDDDDDSNNNNNNNNQFDKVLNKINKETEMKKQKDNNSLALVLRNEPSDFQSKASFSQMIVAQRKRQHIAPEWHSPWKLFRVISGHLGWVRCVDFDPANEWFATGSADRTIKIWDLASGQLKLTLTGHIATVMDLVVSKRHPYLFSVGQDKSVKCWDLEQNKVIRHYFGHLSGVFSCALHPTLDLLFTGGRDSVCRVWDIRTRASVHVLTGHRDLVGSIISQTTDPQVITGSHDQTIKLWDLAKGEAITTLTSHKKSVRALAFHPSEYTFASGSSSSMKIWKLPRGEFLRNVDGHDAIINTLAINHNNVLVSGGDNGTMKFWDWRSGYCFQSEQTIAQPGSLESEAGIFQAKFDQTGSRLITVEADKSIKVWKEDAEATPESYPIDFQPPKRRKRY